MSKRGRKLSFPNIGLHIFLIIICFITFFPFILALNISLKDNFQFAYSPFSFAFPFHGRNYILAWISIAPYILNSLIVSLTTVAGVILLTALSGYAFARFSFPGKELLYYLVISILMIPGILVFVPQFMVVKTLGLLNTRMALILPWIAGGQIIGIFLVRSFMASIPQDLFDSAKIDGASDFKAFLFIALPLCKPILGTVAIMNLVGTWNEYIWPLTVLNSKKIFPLSIGLLTFQNEHWTAWGCLFAGYVIASIPLLIVFAFASKLFIKGLTSGAIKM